MISEVCFENAGGTMNKRVVLALFLLASAAACSTVLGFDPLTLDSPDASSPEMDATSGASDADSDATAMDAPTDVDAAATCVADFQNDPKHCGRCGHDCLGGACTLGVCQAAKLADGLGVAEGLAVDDTAVFVAEYDTNRILKFSKKHVPSVCMGVPQPAPCIFTDDQSNVFKPTAMAVDATHVYWINAGPSLAGEVRSCPRAGCGGQAAKLIASISAGAFDRTFGSELLPLDMVIRNGRVFWAENATGAIRSAPVDGGSVTTYLENDLFWPVAVAVDNDSIYFTGDNGPTAIRSVPLDGSGLDGGPAVKVVAETPSRPLGIVLTAGGVLYWSVPRVGSVGDGVIQAAPKTGTPGGGPPVGALAIDQIEPTSLLVDAKNIYWVQGGSDTTATGMVVTCPLTGCPSSGPIVLASRQNVPRHLAQDDQAIYWSTVGLASSTNYDSQVWKVAKP